MYARLAELHGTTWARIAVRVLAVGLVVVLALRLRELWRQHPVDLSTVDAPLLVLAAACSFAAVVAYGAVWPLILKRMGSTPPRGAIRLFLQSQLAKYLPGSVWHYAGRVGLARSRGLPVRTTILSLAIELAASAFAALAVAVFLLPAGAAVPVLLALVALVLVASRGNALQRLLDPLRRMLRRVFPLEAEDEQRTLRALLPTSVLYVPVWALYGVAFWLTARALFAIPPGDLAYFTSAFALGWLAGMVAVFAPGGIGVREAVLVALIGPRLGQAEAIVIATTSRLLLTAADLAGGGGAVLLPRLWLRRVAGATE